MILTKSAPLASDSIITFDGLMSRWTTPQVSAAASARVGLFDDLKRLRHRQWSGSLDSRFERFAFHQLHRVKAFAVLFAVMNDARDVRMMNLRGGAGFTQKTRPCHRIIGQFPADHL